MLPREYNHFHPFLRHSFPTHNFENLANIKPRDFLEISSHFIPQAIIRFLVYVSLFAYKPECTFFFFWFIDVCLYLLSCMVEKWLNMVMDFYLRKVGRHNILINGKLKLFFLFIYYSFQSHNIHIPVYIFDCLSLTFLPIKLHISSSYISLHIYLS